MRKTVYRFRNFQLDPKYRELRCDGQLIGLPLKSFECLLYLVEHHDRAVGRDELIAAVWGKTDINDHTLAQTLSRVRQALRDATGDMPGIRTVPRFGYHWIEPTRRVEMDVEDGEVPVAGASVVAPTPTLEEAAPGTPSPRQQRRWLAGLAGGAALAAALAWVHVTLSPAPGRASPPAAQTAPATNLAAAEGTYLVMPVVVETEAPGVAWIRLGVMDYIGVALKEGGASRVLPNDQILNLTAGAKRSGQLEGAELARLKALTGATHVLQAHAQGVDGGWRFDLDLFHGDSLRSYSGTAAMPLEAARIALQSMLSDLDLADSLAPPSSRDETLQRIDAALLVGDLAQAQQLLDASAALVAENPAFRQRAGQLALRRGQLDEARQAFHATIDGELSPGASRELRAEAWAGLGGAELQRPDFAAAQAAFTEAIALVGDHGSQQLLGNAYLSRGASFANRNRFEEAMADFGRARVALDRAGDRIGIARLDINIAAADAFRGRLPQALEAQNRSIQVLTAFGVRDQLLVVLHNKIYVQLGLLDLEGATETSREAFEQAQRFDNERMRKRIAAARARVLLTTGQLSEAGRLIDRFDAAGAATSDPEFVSLRLEWLLERGDYDRAANLAMDSMRRALAAKGLASDAMLPWTCLSGIEAALKSGRADLAERLLQSLEQAPEAARDTDRSMIVEIGRAELARTRGRTGEAQPLYSAALASAEHDGDTDVIITVASMWLRHLIDRRDLEAAAPVAGRLKAYSGKDYRAARVMQAYYRASGQLQLANEAESRVRALAGERDSRLPL